MPAPWRNGAGRALRLFLLVVQLAFASLSHAQGQPTFWDARRLLSSTTEPTVRLLEKDREVARVERARVQQFVDVIDRIGGQFSITPEVVLIQGQAPNAFATRGKDGKPLVGVNLPMLDLAGTDPDLAAVVVGHEMAHLQLNHLDEGRQRAAAIGVLSVIVGAVAGYNVAKRGVNPAPVMDVALLGGALTNRKFDRDQEREADDVGIKAMHRAGYDVYAAPRLWERMQQIGGGGSGWWLSTHPGHDERIETLRKVAVAMRPEGPKGTMVATAAPATAAPAAAPDVAATTSSVAAGPALAEPAATWSRSGSSPWCLAGSDGSQALCSYATWSECNDARPNSSFRCLGRDSDVLKSTQPAAAAPASGQSGQSSHAWCSIPGAGPDNRVWMTLEDCLRNNQAGNRGFGNDSWCLADPYANRPLCYYLTYEACAAAKPTASYRCIASDNTGNVAATSRPPITAVPSAAQSPPVPNASMIAPSTANTPPATTESPTARRLRELQQLRKEGLITEAEYNAKRKAILSEL